MQKLVQDRIRDFGQAGSTQLEVEFPDPTYISVIQVTDERREPIEDLKIVNLVAALEIAKKTEIRPLISSAAATYLFKNAIEGDQRYLLVAGHESELVAELSIPFASISGETDDYGSPLIGAGTASSARSSLRCIPLPDGPNTAAGAIRGSIACRTRALDYLVWPNGVSLDHTRPHTAV